MSYRIRFQIELNAHCTLKHEALAMFEAVAWIGSIQQAARHLGHSYHHAWKLVHDLNESFAVPLMHAEHGGPGGGGGIRLTPLGLELLRAVGNIRRQIDLVATAELATIGSNASTEKIEPMPGKPAPRRARPKRG